MAKRGFLRESGGQDAQSERPASWHGQARSHRRDPWKSLMNPLFPSLPSLGCIDQKPKGGMTELDSSLESG
jgi:hypothetical protein